MGYKKEDSTICLSFPQSYIQHYPPGTDAENVLQSCMDNMPRSMRHTIVFNPAYAKNLTREGFDKEKIKKYLAERKLIPASQVRPNIGAFVAPGSDVKNSAQDAPDGPAH